MIIKTHIHQDSALPHTAKAVQTWLKDQFDKKFIDKVM